jgi:glutamine synthetase
MPKSRLWATSTVRAASHVHRIDLERRSKKFIRRQCLILNLSEFWRFTISAALSNMRAMQLNTITNPGTNSTYSDWCPALKAPVKLASARNRSASIRVPYLQSDKARRGEVPSRTRQRSHSYGIRRYDDRRSGWRTFRKQNSSGTLNPSDKEIYMTCARRCKIPTVCSSLDQALDALDADKFLTRSGVFSNGVDARTQNAGSHPFSRMTTHPG